MIIDTLSAGAANPLYPPVIRRTLQAIIDMKPDTLPAGKYPLQGDTVFFSVNEGQTRPHQEQRPEFHRQYLDIHIVLAGEEIIGAAPQGQPLHQSEPFNDAFDLGFCTGISGETLIHLAPGSLAIIFPQELHRPMCATGAPAAIRKIVVKIDCVLFRA